MPIKVNYGGNEIVSPDDSTKATVNCKGKLLEDNIVIDASGINEKDSDTLVQLVEGTLTEIYNDKITKLRLNAFVYLTTLVSVDFPNVTSSSNSVFIGAKSLKKANLPKLATLTTNIFRETGLEYFDGVQVSKIQQFAFQNASTLSRLFLRKADAICTLDNVNAFEGTPFVKTFGYAYVPRALIETYMSATNWYGLYNIIWEAIEDYTVDGTITGEIDWKLVNGFALFTIDGKRYYHKVDTWKSWCDNDEENTDGFKIGADGSVMSPDGKYVYDSSGNKQTGTGQISLDGEEYYTA